MPISLASNRAGLRMTRYARRSDAMPALKLRCRISGPFADPLTPDDPYVNSQVFAGVVEIWPEGDLTVGDRLGDYQGGQNRYLWSAVLVWDYENERTYFDAELYDLNAGTYDFRLWFPGGLSVVWQSQTISADPSEFLQLEATVLTGDFDFNNEMTAADVANATTLSGTVGD